MDTSGVVYRGGPLDGDPLPYLWSDLDAFTQGYIEAIARDSLTNFLGLELCPFGFSDLAPEALAAILKDCSDFLDGRECMSDVSARMCGGQFWTNRNKGWTALSFGPLTPTIRDDGKVYLTAQDALK